jgi:uncharacterized membrane protein YdjX (TVP38/TMEM64 family)
MFSWRDHYPCSLYEWAGLYWKAYLRYFKLFINKTINQRELGNSYVPNGMNICEGVDNRMKKKIIKVIIISLFVLGLIWFYQSYLQISPQQIRDWILSFGIFAPVLFMIIYTIRPLILFPASILSLGGGLAFGAFWGTVFTVIGATTGAALSFWVARKLGKNIANKTWKGKGEVIQHQLEQRGFLYVILLRLIPVFNFDLISYLAGISKIKFKAFFLGTLLGIIPGTFAYNFLGSSIVDGSLSTILIAILLFAVVLCVPLLINQDLKYKLGLSSGKKET